MKNYKTEFDQPYNVTPGTKRFWEEFIEQTQQGNPENAINSYRKFCVERNRVFNMSREADLTQ